MILQISRNLVEEETDTKILITYKSYIAPLKKSPTKIKKGDERREFGPRLSPFDSPVKVECGMFFMHTAHIVHLHIHIPPSLTITTTLYFLLFCLFSNSKYKHTYTTHNIIARVRYFCRSAKIDRNTSSDSKDSPSEKIPLDNVRWGESSQIHFCRVLCLV